MCFNELLISLASGAPTPLLCSYRQPWAGGPYVLAWIAELINPTSAVLVVVAVGSVVFPMDQGHMQPVDLEGPLYGALLH